MADKRSAWRALGVLLLVTLALLIALDRPLIRGDGVAYLAWVDTLVLDFDLTFDNQLARLAPVNTYQITWNETTQRWVNIFPFGAAVLQAPFYAVGHAFALRGWWDANPDYFHQMQGVWRPYSLWLMLGANVWGLATVALGWRISRLWLKPWPATLVTFALFVGTPLVYYASVSPLNSHNPGAFLTTLMVYGLVGPLGAWPGEKAARPATWLWLALGVCGGLMMLTRWQLALVAAPIWLLVLWPRRWRGPLLALGAAALTTLPLPLVWQTMFGRPFVVPYQAVTDAPFLTFPGHTWEVALLWLRHSPLLWLALAGLPFVWRRSRRWALAIAIAIGLQLWLNGGVLDWWAGETYGMRRMSELFPVYVVAVSALLAPTGAQGWERYRPAVAGALIAALILYTAFYLLLFINYTWTNPAQEFINDPAVMFAHWQQQEQPWQTTLAVWRAHLGPLAWSQPGP